MAKKIVAIIGTYRKGRVIDTAVTEILKGAEAQGAETLKIYLIDEHIDFCKNCRKCTQEKDVGNRAKCVHDDDMDDILKEVDSAEGLVLASPVNFSYVTAITKRFIERLLVYAYWPWGTNIPKIRTKDMNKKAVIVTASGCPALLARIFMRSPLKALKIAAWCMGAKVEKSLYFGAVAKSENSKLNKKDLIKAYQAGENLAT